MYKTALSLKPWKNKEQFPNYTHINTVVFFFDGNQKSLSFKRILPGSIRKPMNTI